MDKLEIDFLIENIKLDSNPQKANCHTNSKIISQQLKKLGYKVKLCKGIYFNYPKSIKHSWIEFENKILETDCKQLRVECDIIPNEPCAVLDKVKVKHRYLKNEK